MSRKSIVEHLVTKELGFCCVRSFLREVKGCSGHKVSLALGVSSRTIDYWRDKLALGKLPRCPNCHLPQTQLQLSRTASGKPFFVRSPPARASVQRRKKDSSDDE